MVIVHLITTLEYGGAETQLQRLILASNKERFRHIVICLAEGGPIGSELMEAGIEVHPLGIKRGSWSPWGTLKLVRLLNSFKPDVLHCWLYHSCLMGWVAERFAPTKRLIWALRSANPSVLAYSMQLRAIIRLCARLSGGSDCIIVNSETAKRVHQQWGYDADKMKVIVNGIDLTRFFPDLSARGSVREELGISDDCRLVGLIARFHPMKDHKTFLRTAGSVHQHHQDIHFLFAGQGMVPENEALQRLIAENHLQQVVHLLGPRRDIPRLTAALDISCLSSWSESFPNVVPEAMSCGVPCVATDVGDTAHIIANTGKVVPPRDPDRLAAAIEELIAMSAEERLALGRRARERVLAQFSLQRFVAEHEKIYEQLGVPHDSLQ